MKFLVAFYSRTDSNRKVAKEIADILKSDIGEILPEEKYTGFLGFLKGGYQAARKKMINVSSPKDPEGYDLVVVVGPLWVGSLSPPLRAYVSKNKFKKLAFFSCNGSGKTQKALEQFRELNKIPIETGIVSQKDVNDKLHHDKVIEFCDSIKKLSKKK